MSEKPEIKKTRKCTFKSKRGCKTCKFRHVKCDETRPSCLRCLRWGVDTCGGYIEAAPVRKLVTRPVHQLLQPALSREPYIGPHFRSEEEHRYFQHFRIEVTPYLGGVYENSLWERLVAQACVNEPFVLDAVIAIGALAKAISAHGKSKRPEHSLAQVKSTCHELYATSYEYSLKRYDKAIKIMKSALCDREPDVRKALIACLLRFCFETHIGNQASAIYHAQSGITLLHQQQSKQEGLEMTDGKPQCIVESELVQALGRLDLQVLILLDLRPLEFHRAIKKDLSATLQYMPSVFRTLAEAKTWCELIMRQTLHFRAESMAVGKSHKIEMKGPPLRWEDTIDTPMGASVLHDPYEVPVALLPEYRAQVLRWNRWSIAFQSLFASLRASRHKDCIGATLVLIQAKMNSICLASAFSTMETIYDDFLVEFQQIMALADSVHETLAMRSGGRFLYQFDGGILPPLFLVATKCRDRTLRRKAIELLSSAPWREGVFDSVCCQNMATWIMQVEEEGLAEAEVVPEHRRLKIRRSHIDLPRRRVQLQGTQLRNPGDVEPEWMETVITW